MTTSIDASSDPTADAVEAARESSIRRDHYAVPGPISVIASTASGSVLVKTGESDSCEVTITARSHSARERLRDVEVSYDEGQRQLRVVTQPRPLSRRWLFDVGRSDFNVELTIPQGSNLEVRTASGDTRATGTYGEISVTSASGQVFVGEALGSCHVTQASGDTEIGVCRGVVQVKTASGDINVRKAHGDAKLHSVSGNVELGISSNLDAKLNSVSGNILVLLEKGLTIDVNASTLSGEISSEIDLGGATGSSGSSGAVTIKMTTVSGNVSLRRA